MGKESFPIPDQKKERFYEEKVELGKISVDSGVVNLADPCYSGDEDIEEHGIEVPIGNDGTFKVFGIYRVREFPVPKKFAKGREDATVKNKQLLRLEFEKI